MTNPDDIVALHDRLVQTKSPFIAVDTEFIRQKTFYPELSLIQIAFEDSCSIIDALSPKWNPRILKPILFQNFLTLVFHSCRQDLEIFFHMYKELPCYIFDTQIAAIFIGMSTSLSSSISYSDLVNHYLHIAIDKSQQHTDWMRRPLDFKQVQYAAKDVIYLADIYPMMMSDLENNGRLSWALDEMRSLSNPGLLNQMSPSRLSRMGIQRKNLALAKALFAFQNEHASHLNMNRARFLSDKTIATMTLFQSAEKLMEFAKRTTSLEQQNLLEALMDVFERYKDAPDDDPFVPLTPLQQKTLTQLRKHCDERASALNLPASFLASSEDLRAYVTTQSGRLSTTWRKEAMEL